MRHTNVSMKLVRLVAVILLATLAVLGLLVTLALAQNTVLPPGGSTAFIQTSGPNAPLSNGDWYASNDPSAGNREHSFPVFVPCSVAPTTVYTLELFDPESYDDPAIVEPVLDEIRPPAAPVPDDATFSLYAPDNSLITTATYTPTGGTNDTWTLFATISSGAYGCGTYVLRVRTSDDDENAWRLQISGEDAIPGNGDEAELGVFETSFQHFTPDCQDFHFFVPDQADIRLSNFDMDSNTSITYFPADGSTVAGNVSGGTVWNNGGGATFPPPGGDVITVTNSRWGWWRTEICANPLNQYVFSAGGLPFFFQQPAAPNMTLTKDDGLTVVVPGQYITYTMTYQNLGPGAALNVTLTDNIPQSTSYVSCGGGTSCGETPPGSGVVNYTVGTVIAGATGQLTLTVRVDPFAPPSQVLTNTAQLEYEDTMGNRYPPVEASDVDTLPAASADLRIVKSDEPDPVTPGNTLTYTLVISNAGPDTADNVVVADTLPGGVTLVSATPSQGTCNGTTCDLGNLTNGAQASITIVVTVNVGTAGPLLNTAQVSSDTPDPDPSNNTANEPTAIPSSGTGGGGDDDDDDDDGGPPPPPAAPQQPLPTPAVAPTPAVSLLPETGIGNRGMDLLMWPFVALPGLGLLLGWVLHHHSSKEER